MRITIEIRLVGAALGRVDAAAADEHADADAGGDEGREEQAEDDDAEDEGGGLRFAGWLVSRVPCLGR
jgi:hypothetical protein